jgi:hypothetical protein
MAKDPILDRVILQLSDKDVVRFRDIIEGGCLITGGLGSGKSSTSARNLALSLLSGCDSDIQEELANEKK